MTQPERLGRELTGGRALEIKCRACRSVTTLSRAVALERFGESAMVGYVREKARCAACGKGDCFIQVIDAAPPGAAGPPAPHLAPFPVERITFAVCHAARWSVYGGCDPCRVLKALYAAGANSPPVAPGRVIHKAFTDRKLVCAHCRTPFARVSICAEGPARDIAIWSAGG